MNKRKNPAGSRRGPNRAAKRTADVPMLRHCRSCFIETLEDRQMLSGASPFTLATTIGDLPIQLFDESDTAASDIGWQHALDRAFDRASDLSQYTPEQLSTTGRWVVQTADGFSAEALSATTGLNVAREFESLSSTFVVTSADSNALINTLNDAVGIEHFYPLVPVHGSRQAVGDGLPNDTYFPEQWGVLNTGQLVSNPDFIDIFATIGQDINVIPAWDAGYTGDGVVLAIVDDGVQWQHPDIFPNFSLGNSFDFEARDGDPAPNNLVDLHGTAVAGVAGASGGNGEGITGVAPGVELAGLRLPIGSDPLTVFTDELIFDALTFNVDDIAIFNNSWNVSSDGTPRSVTPIGPLHTLALRDAFFSLNSRGGLGVVNVVAAGNDALFAGNPPNEELALNIPAWATTNYDAFTNNPFVIAVGAVDHNGITTGYSEGGASLFLVAPSGTRYPYFPDDPTDPFAPTPPVAQDGSAIYTTDLIASFGYNAPGILNDNAGRDFLENINYTSRFSGTSIAAAEVSGVIALMLEANPNLSVRDIQQILARSSRQNDQLDIGWDANWDPIFVDPETDDDGFPITDPSFYTFLGGNSEWQRPALPSNRAGFTVHDSQDYGYGHGIVDAQLAVAIAERWATQFIAGEAGNSFRQSQQSSESQRWIFPGESGDIPSRFSVCDDAFIIPSNLGGKDDGTTEFYELWLCPPDELPEEAPENNRGDPLTTGVFAWMTVETLEVTMVFDEYPADGSDNLRLTVVSPEGTHADFVNYLIHPGTRPPINFVDADGGTEDELVWTFTTNRFWGERASTEQIDPTGGLYGWDFSFENWGEEDFHLSLMDITWRGTEFAPGTGRIQGRAGLDVNADGQFNFSGLVDDTGTPLPNDTFDLGPYTFVDVTQEPFAALATIYVDINNNGALDPLEPSYVTGADGNFYFDLSYGTYTLRQLDPPGAKLIGDPDPAITVTLAPPEDVPFLPGRVRDVNFLYAPSPFNLEGTVFADLNEDGRQNPGEPGATQFVVYVDLDNDGQFDFIDGNFNFVFDYDIDGNATDGDVALEPFQVTDGAGAFSISVGPESGYDGLSGYQGTGTYTLAVIPRFGWTPISPVIGLQRVFAEGGKTVVGLDFAQLPELGVLAGNVFMDLNGNNIFDPGEGVDGFTIFLDLDHDTRFGLGDPAVVSSGDGAWGFTDVPFDIYDIFIVNIPGWEVLDPASGMLQNVILEAGSPVSGLNFRVSNFETRDYGDLPSIYEAGSTPANHGIFRSPPFYLGDDVFGTSGPGESPGAGGGSALNDNDGVDFVDPFVPGGDASIRVTARSGFGTLQGWADFNGDGDFDDLGERIFEEVFLAEGANVLLVSVPTFADPGGIFIRFRYGEGGIDSPFGAAVGGEVEDYLVPTDIELPTGDYTGDGIVNGNDFLVWQDNFGTQSGATQLDGDGDGDGDVDGNDFLIWQANFGSGAGSAAAVVANDEKVEGDPGHDRVKEPKGGLTTVRDFATEARHPIANMRDFLADSRGEFAPSGDFDKDGLVDSVDFAIWERGFGIEEGATISDGDADGDGDVDGDDFLIWQSDFGQVAEETPEVTAETTADEEAIIESPPSARVELSEHVAPAKAPRLDTKPIRLNQTTTKPTELRSASVFDPAPILVTGDPVVATQLEPVRIETSQLAITAAPIEKSAARPLLGDEDSLRFDLALDELDAISPAQTGARAKLVGATPFADRTPVPAGLARESAFDEVPEELRNDAGERDATLFELLATDRVRSTPRLDASVDAKSFSRRRP